MKFTSFLFLALALAASAQRPPLPGTPGSQPVLPTPVPTIPETEPAPRPGSFIPGRQIDPNALVIPASGSMNEANITALAAAQLYEDHSGKRVIMSNAVAQSEVSFTMRGPLTNAEIAKFLKLTLLAEGLAMIPIPGEPNIVRLVPSGPITSVSAIPKDFYTNEFDLPVDDQLVSYQMLLRYLKPDEALRIMQSAIGQLSASGNISAVPNASSLIITENSSLIRQMIKIKNAIDVPTAVGEKWVEVTYGDVEEIAERMNEIYNDQSSGRQATRTTRANVPPSPGAAPGAATSGEEIPIRIIGVRRTSRILLVGRPADLVAAEAMVRTFDQPSSGKTRKTFRLRYLRVGDFIQIAENAISVTLGDGASGPGGAGAAGGRQAGGQGNNRNNQNRNQNNQNTGQQGGAGGNRATIQEQDIPTAPESLLVGNTLLVGDNVANTIIVNGPPHHIEIIRDLIADLDSESQQVALSAVIGSYGLTDGLNFGIDLARAIRQSGSSFVAGGAAAFANGVIDPDILEDLGGILTANGAGGSGVSIYGEINDDFAFFVNALETETRFKTLERTVLTTRNNRVATLSSGQRIAIPSSTFQGGTATGQTTNVEFRDVTLELQIQPLINSDNQITLEISLVRDSIGNDRTVGELLVPDINTEQLTTSVTVQDGSAVILGGIITTTDRNTRNGIPILSSIPGIGKLFGRTVESEIQSELVIMIQPRIIKTQAQLNGFRHDYEQTSRHTGEVTDSFPQNSGVLPAQGTLRQYEPEPAPQPPARARRATERVDDRGQTRKSKIRRRSGRPGR